MKSHAKKTSTDEDWLVIDEQRRWFLEMKSNPGKDTANIVKMIKDVECITLTQLIKQLRLERIHCNLESCNIEFLAERSGSGL